MSIFAFSNRGGVGTLVVLVTAAAGCSRPNEYQAPPPPEVAVAYPVQQSVTDYVVETGTTEAARQAEVRARVTGFLEEIRFEPGQEVSEEDVLYLIQQREFKAKLDSAKAELTAREVELDTAETEYKREKSLQEKNATTDRNVVLVKAKRDAAQAAVKLAAAKVELAQMDMDDTEVRALIDGRVGRTLVKVGNLVDGTERTPLTTIVDYDPIYANFTISERQLLAMLEKTGSRKDRVENNKEKLKLYLQRASDDGFPFEGQFDYADLAVDQGTGTYMVRGVFPNPRQEIIPGLFVRIKIPLGTIENALLIPEQAVGSDQRGDFVLVVTDEDDVERRKVTLGIRHDGMVVIAEGITPGDRVIVDGLQRARPGAPVRAEEVELPRAAQGLEVITEGKLGPREAVAPDDEAGQEQDGQDRGLEEASPAEGSTDAKNDATAKK